MKRKFTSLIILFLAALKVAAQEQEVIKVDTTLVSVPVTISDRSGRYIPNLKAEDFTLFADGKQQKIEFFAATEEPLNVALLIDTSRSTETVLEDIKEAARDFIKLLKPQDRAMIVSFDYETHVLCNLTADRDELKRAIKNAEIGAEVGTTLRDAVFETASRSLAKVRGRKAIILLTDGKDAGSEISTDELHRALEESDAPVYSAFYQTTNARRFNQNRNPFPQRGGRRGGVFGGGRFPRGDRFPRDEDDRSERRRERVERKNEEAKEFLQSLADETAGRAFAGEVSDLKKTFGDIVDELRFQYRLGFYPPDDDERRDSPHSLRVRIARPDAVVRARSSYRIQQ